MYRFCCPFYSDRLADYASQRPRPAIDLHFSLSPSLHSSTIPGRTIIFPLRRFALSFKRLSIKKNPACKFGLISRNSQNPL